MEREKIKLICENTEAFTELMATLMNIRKEYFTYEKVKDITKWYTTQEMKGIKRVKLSVEMNLNEFKKFIYIQACFNRSNLYCEDNAFVLR